MSVQRTNYFISKEMQSKFAGTILLLALLVTVITACNIYVLGSYFYDSTISPSDGKTLSMVMSTFLSTYWPRLIILVLVNIIIVFVVSVMYSHQIAGPAYKLEKSIERITGGDLTFEVSLRRNDNLKELASALNGLLEKFRSALRNAKSLTNDISDSLKGLENEEKFKKLSQDAVALRALIDEFKLDVKGDNKEVVDDLEAEEKIQES